MPEISNCVSVADLKAVAKKQLPKVMFDFIEGGSEDEISVKWNKEAFSRYEFVPRVLEDVTSIDLSVSVQGVKLDIPVLTAPTAQTLLFHHGGETAVARATHAAGSAYCLSTMSSTSIEDVAGRSPGPLFFQIYAWQNREMVNEFLTRCKSAGYSGLMLAVDLPVVGKRERDLRNGHGRPPVLKRNTALSALSKPAWLFHYLTKPKPKMANMIGYLPHGADAFKTIAKINEQFRTDVTWKDAEDMCRAWDGKFMLKGVQSVADAVKAKEIGATGIVLSNHGGRQLDGSPAAIDLLPEVRQAVGNDMEIIIDGGVRRGSDVVKAIALGANAVLVGRPYLYGLAAGGEAGVARCYEILRDETERVMKLIGCTSMSDLDSSYVRRRAY